MRVAVGGIMQETNTFCAVTANMSDFAPYIRRGDEIQNTYQQTRTPIGGFLDAAQKEALTPVPTFFAKAVSSGLTERRTYEGLVDDLIESVRAAGPVDGVLLALHGAMAADGAPDADGEIASRIRRVVGPEVPIAVEVDLHANISQRLADNVNVLTGYDTYPHIDIYDRAVEAGTLLARTMRGQVRPSIARAAVPLLLVPQMQLTSRPPMATLIDEAHRLETEPGMLAVTVAGGFCYADVPHAGVCVVAVSDGGHRRAKEAASKIARQAWEKRDAFAVRNLSVTEGVAKALRADHGPVIVVDVGDNIGGGGPGDGTVLLQQLMAANPQSAVIAIADGEAVAAAVDAGVGSTVRTTVGGKVDARHGPAVEVTGVVRVITNGRYVNKGPYMTGAVVEMGRSAVVQVGGIELLLTERKTSPFDLEQLRSVGIEPTNRRIIVVKAAIAWRAAYEPIAADIIEVDTPGVTSTDLSSFNFNHLRRPIYPLDPDARYPVV